MVARARNSSGSALAAAAAPLLQRVKHTALLIAVALGVAVPALLLVGCQALAAAVVRLCRGQPPARRVVQAARDLQQQQRLLEQQVPDGRCEITDDAGGDAAEASCPTGKATSSTSSSSEEAVRPRHICNQPEQGHDSEAWRLVGPYMRAYGRHAVANSQLFNPEFIHFFVPGLGSLPYVMVDSCGRAVIVAIGHPLAAPQHWHRITAAFLATFPDAYVYHATEPFARLLHDAFGMYVNSAGIETTLQVQSWAYNGRTRTVRAAARAAREAGVRVRELAPHELTPEMRAMLQHEVSSDWLAQKAVADRELRVFVRAVDYEHMELRDGVRIFVAEAYADPASAPPAVVDAALQGAGALNAKPPKPPRCSGKGRSLPASTAASSAAAPAALDPQAPDDSPAQPDTAAASDQRACSSRGPTKQLVGFVLLDPLWEDGQVVGFVTSLSRQRRSAHQGTLKLLYEDIISRLRAEGRSELAFGFAPLCNLQDDRGWRHLCWMRWLAVCIFTCANRVYAFQSLAFSKLRYGGGLNASGSGFNDPAAAMTRVYMATRRASPVTSSTLLDLFLFFSHVGIIGGPVAVLAKLVGLMR